MQNRHGGFQILLRCPPRILETGTYSRSMLGAEEKSAALPALYKALADHHQIGFFDTNTVIASGNWSDPSVWQDGALPAAGARIVVPQGLTLTVDSVLAESFKTLRIDGG